LILAASKKETVASALLRGMQSQEFELRSAAEAMPAAQYSYRPAEGEFKNDPGPASRQIALWRTAPGQTA